MPYVQVVDLFAGCKLEMWFMPHCEAIAMDVVITCCPEGCRIVGRCTVAEHDGTKLTVRNRGVSNLRDAVIAICNEPGYGIPTHGIPEPDSPVWEEVVSLAAVSHGVAMVMES